MELPPIVQIERRYKGPDKNKLLPAYATKDSAGADIRADVESPVTILPGKRAIIPTGLYMAIPRGWEGQVRSRSGLAIKHGVFVLNSPGTIDADYRGEVGVILANLGDEPFTVMDGDRIAQLVISPVTLALFYPVPKLDSDTERGTGGFGSSGVK